MTHFEGIEYGACPCGGRYEGRTVEVRMTVKGQLVLLSDVPQGACPVCTGRVYKADVLERVEATMRGEDMDPRQNRPAW